MRMNGITSLICALVIAAAFVAPRLQAQPAAPATIQAALAKDAATLGDKFTGLARVMAGKYDWKPGQGVRSAGDVFNLIVTENGMLAGVLTGAAGQGGRPAPITDPEKMQEALRTSYASLQKTIAGLLQADLTGLAEEPIHPFPTPGKAIKKISSSPDKKRMLERLHAKYTYLCSFAHALPAANVFKNIFDSRFPDRRFLRDSEVKNRYERAVASEAYLTSFMSIAQCTAELSVLYPNNIEIIEAACRAWKQLSGASLFTKAVWEIRTQKLLGAIA